MRAKLKFIIRFVSFQSPRCSLKTSTLKHQSFVYHFHNIHFMPPTPESFSLYKRTFIYSATASFLSQAESLMERNRTNICCKFINMSVSVEDGLCQQFSMCFLNRWSVSPGNLLEIQILGLLQTCWFRYCVRGPAIWVFIGPKGRFWGLLCLWELPHYIHDHIWYS